jgi:hypothetical protein
MDAFSVRSPMDPERRGEPRHLESHSGGGGGDLRPSLLDVLRRRPLLIAFVSLLTAAAVHTIAGARAPIYQATGHLFLIESNADLLQVDSPTWVDPARETRTRAELLRSSRVFEATGRRMGLSAAEVADKVDVIPSRTQDVISITARESSPTRAARIVRVVQAEYARAATVTRQAPYNAALTTLRNVREELLKRVGNLQQQSAVSTAAAAELAVVRAELRDLAGREADLATKAGLLGSGVRYVEPPIVPEAAVSPRPMRAAALALVAAFLASLGFLWARLTRNPLVNSGEVAAAALETPLLAELPALGRLPLRRRARLRARSAAFSLLALAVRDEGAGMVAVTAARPSDLGSRIALGVAGALSDAGASVLLVDAESTDADLSAELGISVWPGFANIDRDANLVSHLSSKTNAPGGTTFNVLGIGRGTASLSEPELFERYAAALHSAASRYLVVLNGPTLTTLLENQWVGDAGLAAIVIVRDGTPVRELEDLRTRLDVLGFALLGCAFDRDHASSNARIELARLVPSRTRRSALVRESLPAGDPSLAAVTAAGPSDRLDAEIDREAP